MTNPIPENYHAVTPMLTLKDSRKAIAFYQKAFGAKENFVMPGPDGKGVMHAELSISDSIIMLGDENPGQPCKSAETVGTSPVGFYLYVKDVDAEFNRAVEAGGSAQMPVQDMFWGDRIGSIKDPFGYTWTIATHTEELTSEEIARRAKLFYAQAT